MNKDMKLKPANDISKFGSIVVKAQRNSLIGWVMFLIVLGVLVIQNFLIAFIPSDAIAVDENGRYVGQVLYDEAFYRNETQILKDIKSWVQNCNSLDQVTIFEDTQICLNHMVKELQESRLNELLATNYVPRIEANGCKNTKYSFSDSSVDIDRKNKSNIKFSASIKGEVICNDTGRPIPQGFYHSVSGYLVDRTTNYPLAIKVNSFGDL